MLVLFIIFTGCLFSQSEENKIIKVDTVIRVDTIIVKKIDTVVIKKLVNKSEEKKDFIQNDFYNDNLPLLKGNSADKKTMGIFLLEGGALVPTGHRAGSVASYISISLKAPISENLHFTPRCALFIGEGADGTYPMLSFMLGQYFPLDKNKKFFFEGSAGFGFFIFGLYFPINASVYYKTSKHTLLSFGIDCSKPTEVFVFSFSLGLGITY
jgi:hypothetical protein